MKKKNIPYAVAWFASEINWRYEYTPDPLPLQWRHNGHDGISNHQPHKCLLNRLFPAQIKENIKAPCHWPLCGELTGDWWIPHTNGQ